MPIRFPTLRGFRTAAGAFLLYGLLLDLAVGIFIGFAEPRGPVFGLTAGFGAPLSIWGGPGWPMWLGLGLLLATRHYRWAATLLVVHYATLPFELSGHLRASSFEAELALIGQINQGTTLLWAVWCFYLAGQAGAWILIGLGLRRQRLLKTTV